MCMLRGVVHTHARARACAKRRTGALRRPGAPPPSKTPEVARKCTSRQRKTYAEDAENRFPAPAGRRTASGAEPRKVNTRFRKSEPGRAEAGPGRAGPCRAEALCDPRPARSHHPGPATWRVT